MKAFFALLAAALYCAGILIGAGVLTLPFAARGVGFAPLLALIVAMGFALAALYIRIAAAADNHLHHKAALATREATPAIGAGTGVATETEDFTTRYQEKMRTLEARKGASIFVELMDRIGLGRAGRVTFSLGILYYVFPADMGYILLGKSSLTETAARLAGRGSAPSLALGLLGAVLLAAALASSIRGGRPSARRAAALKFLAMAGCWAWAIALLIGVDRGRRVLGGASLGDLLGDGCFTVAILASMFTAAGAAEDTARGHGLTAAHRVSVWTVAIELFLLGVTAIVTLTLFVHAGATEAFAAFTPGWLSLARVPDYARIFGVVLFAYVGTGILNLCSYSYLFKRPAHGGRAPIFTVVVLGSLIPMVAYAIWTLTAAFTLSPDELAAADSAGQGTHLGIAAKAALVDPRAGALIAITASLFALMAVTTACGGFTQTLAERISSALNREPGWSGERLLLRPAIVVLAAAVAMAKDVGGAQIGLTSILGLAGAAGGGLLIIVLPLFFPYPPDRRSRARHWEIGLAVVAGAFLAGIILLTQTTGLGATAEVMQWMKGLMALTVVGLVGWLTASHLCRCPEPTRASRRRSPEPNQPLQLVHRRATVRRTPKGKEPAS